MKRAVSKPAKSNGLAKYSKDELAVFASAIMNRAALAARLGQQYGGDRDVYQALGYPDTIAFDDYYSRYNRQDIARAIINRPISYTWKGPLTITEAGEENDTALEKAWKQLEKELKLKSKFIRLDKLSSVGDYGVLLLGFGDVVAQGDWATPAKGTKRKLNFVKPLHQDHAKIAKYVTNPGDKRYGMVEFYDVEFQDPGGESSTTFKAHYSRVLHVTTELMESEVEGVPVLMSVWNRLMDLEKLVGGSAEMFWRGARPGYQGIMDKDATLTPLVEEGLQDQFNEYEHNQRRFIFNEGIKYEALEMQVADPDKHVDIQIQMISAVTGIPKRILTGSERGELASSQDESSWLMTIQTRREEHADPNIIRPFVDMCIEYGILPKPSTEEYQVEWLDLFAPSDKDKAEVGKIRADALAVYARDPLAQLILPPDAFFEWFLGLNEDQREKIKEMSDEALKEEMAAIAEEIKNRPKPGEAVEEEEGDEEGNPIPPKKKPVRRRNQEE
jgi:hypothetical protein